MFLKITGFFILLFLITGAVQDCHAQRDSLALDFLGFIEKIPFKRGELENNRITFDAEGIHYLESAFQLLQWEPLLDQMNQIRERKQLDDWFFYQLIRRTAQQIIPKSVNYLGYTYCKWMLLSRCGYAPLLRLSSDKVLLYVLSNDSVNNIPYLMRNGQQYVCLNYHDYGYHINFEQENFQLLEKPPANSNKPFTYQITSIPEFSTSCYTERKVGFEYKGNAEEFTIPLNPQMLTYFTNYPVIDYRYQFSVPFSTRTYASLIPQLKKRLEYFQPAKGVEYLMYFVRNAFQFQRDSEHFGIEKRFSPEETLIAEKSDCEDRSALFFALVREIYGLPMIVLSYPEHVTVAVELDAPAGPGIPYNGKIYTLCEPTPQKKELGLGELMPQLRTKNYEVVLRFDAERKEILSTEDHK